MTPADRRTPQGAELTPIEFDPFATVPERVAVTLPLTDPQQEVWAAAQMAPAASTAYNQCFPMRLRGGVAIDSLRAALQQLSARHEALRLSFAETGTHQTIAPAVAIPLTSIDISDLPEEARARAIDDLLVRESRTAFPLSTGPLARVHLVRETADSHVLVFTAHHLICDGWSSGILLQDLGALYTADRHGLPAPLPEPMPYADYVRRAVQSTAETRASEEYWLGRFADGAPVLELPADRRRPAERTFRGSNERLTIDAELYRAIKSLGARHGCTLYVTLLAAWQVLLFRLTSQTDLILGVPVSAQASLDNGNLVGHCVHMLPLRTPVNPSASFARHLTTTRRELMDAHDHRAITFGRLIRQLSIPRDSSHTPLLGVVFNVDRPTEAPHFEGLSLERLAAPRSAANFDIAVDITDSGAALHIECNYNLDLFDAATIRQWLEQYRTLLTAVVADAEIPVERVAFVPAAELSTLRESGRARSTFDVECLHSSFERVAAASPHAEAVRLDKESVSYDTLNRRANRIAHTLRMRGVGPETLVGVCLERSIDLVASILGVLKAGGAYVPLDPDCPTDRIRGMVEDAKPRVVITAGGGLRHFAATRATVLCLDRDRAAIAASADTNPGIDLSPHHLAYVIFTSGSTGRPKGVAVTHANVSRLFSATASWFHFDARDVWTLFHSTAFDFSVWEIWGALLHGGRLVVVPYSISRAPDAFHRLLVEERVTVLNQTPSAFKQLNEVDRTSPAGALALRLVIFGGEALDLGALTGWVERHGDRSPELVNMYGITETTVHVTYRRITVDDVRSAAGRSPIGVPIPDLDLHLLAPGTLELVPAGVAGEICIGGAGVARGYVNGAALAGVRFVANPFGAPGDRLYRSGDLARRLPNGEIEYLGRIDNQVKLRGFRIELGEIESVLLGHASVKDAVVVLTTTAAGEPRLVAYVVAATAGGVRTADLLVFMRMQLPEYMLPGAFVFLDALPINANGKLDRSRLPRLDAQATPLVAAAPPRTATEQAVAEIWCEMLELAEVGAHDRFFDLGGHSMLAVRIVRRLNERFAIGLSVAALFHAPTVATLAHAIDALLLTGGRGAAAPNHEVIEL